MGKLTKALFASTKKALGYTGKLTRKQVQRVFKAAIKKTTPTRKRAPATKKKTQKRRKKKVTKNKRKGGKSMTRTMFKLIRMGSLAAPAIVQAARPMPVEWKLKEIFTIYSGFNFHENKWQPHRLLEGYGAFLGATLATVGIPKLTGIIRRI